MTNIARSAAGIGAGRLHGKAAVVTGAARGIGRPASVAFAREGADVMGIDIAGPVSGAHKITVNAVIAGLIGAPLTAPVALRASARQSPAHRADQCSGSRSRKAIMAKTPPGVPWIEPEAIAPVVLFRASEEAYMVSGASCDVAGGNSANCNA